MIGKVVTAWSGTTGGPGITQLYIENLDGAGLISSSQALSAVNAVRAFWDAIKAYLPDEVILTVQPTVDIYDHGQGALVNSVTAASSPASVQGGSVVAYGMALGMKVNLQTANINNGRRVRGSIYVVPATSAAMTTTGTIASAVRTAVNTAGGTLLSSLFGANLRLLVWGRPVFNEAGALTRQGTVNPVTAIETNEKAAVLRGRRD